MTDEARDLLAQVFHDDASGNAKFLVNGVGCLHLANGLWDCKVRASDAARTEAGAKLLGGYRRGELDGDLLVIQNEAIRTAEARVAALEGALRDLLAEQFCPASSGGSEGRWCLQHDDQPMASETECALIADARAVLAGAAASEDPDPDLVEWTADVNRRSGEYLARIAALEGALRSIVDATTELPEDAPFSDRYADGWHDRGDAIGQRAHDALAGATASVDVR